MQDVSVLIVVPARGGSKGLQRKNILPLCGRPLVEWTFAAIQASGLSGRISPFLSTDDHQIAELGRQIGFEVPFLRPDELATDEASAVDVGMHVADWYKGRFGADPSFLFWLQPTSPFRRPASLAQAVEILGRDSSVDAVIGVKEVHRNLGTLFYANANLDLQALDPAETSDTRRQAIKTLLTPNGALYCARTSALRKYRSYSPRRTRGIVMNQVESIDIDDKMDLQIAEAAAKAGLSWRIL